MDWLRSAIGVVDSSSSRTKKPNAVVERYRREAETSTFDERSDKFIRAQAIRIEMKESELADERAALKNAIDGHRDVEARRHMVRVKQLQKELNSDRAKHQNMSQTGSSISNANQNVAQALLVKDGAEELEQAVQAMDDIDLDEAIDKLQDNAGIVEEHDSRLSEPIFGGGAEMEDEADDELARMMRERDERDAARHNLPDAPHEVGGGKVGEEIGEIRNPVDLSK